MGGLFKRTAAAAPAADTQSVDAAKSDAAASSQAKAAAPLPQEQVDQLSASVRRKRNGTASTITGASAGTTAGSVASKALLGQ